MNGLDITPRIRQLRLHCILFLNISKYSAGTVPWGESRVPHLNDPFEPQRMDDGFIEVVGCTATSLAALQVCIFLRISMHYLSWPNWIRRFSRNRKMNLFSINNTKRQNIGPLGKLRIPQWIKIRCSWYFGTWDRLEGKQIKNFPLTDIFWFVMVFISQE